MEKDKSCQHLIFTGDDKLNQYKMNFNDFFQQMACQTHVLTFRFAENNKRKINKI